MLVIPNSALGNDQEGDYVLVVEANDSVARRTIQKGPLTTAGRAIRKGVTATDRVIVNGQVRARPGAKVTPVKGPSVSPGSRSAGIPAGVLELSAIPGQNCTSPAGMPALLG